MPLNQIVENIHIIKTSSINKSSSYLNKETDEIILLSDDDNDCSRKSDNINKINSQSTKSNIFVHKTIQFKTNLAKNPAKKPQKISEILNAIGNDNQQINECIKLSAPGNLQSKWNKNFSEWIMQSKINSPNKPTLINSNTNNKLLTFRKILPCPADVNKGKQPNTEQRLIPQKLNIPKPPAQILSENPDYLREKPETFLLKPDVLYQKDNNLINNIHVSDHNLYSKTILKNTFPNTNRLLNSNKPEPKKNGYPKELDFSKNNIRTVPLYKPYIIPSQTYPSKFNEFINKIKTPQQINYKKVKKSDKSNLTNSNKYNITNENQVETIDLTI